MYLPIPQRYLLNSNLMKSSSSSSSSSSTLAFFDSQRSGSGGCILSVLRRILCSKTLPSDMCSCSDDHKMVKDGNQAVVVPGLVARLMGLDSIPERRITKSRSLNSTDDFQNRAKMQLHKRSKSSREIHSYIELDDDDFIVLKFDNRKKSFRTKQKGVKIKTLAVASPEILEEEQRQHGRLLPNEQVANAKQVQSTEADSRNKKHIRLVQKTTQSTSSDTEESSPVSTLDFQEPTSADDDSWTRSSISSSSSRVTSPEQDNTKISTSLIDNQNPEEAVERRHKVALLNNTVVVVHFNGQKKKKEMWDKVCNITVAEIKGGATHIEDTYNWIKEDLAAEFEVHIMDQLLNDLVLLLHLHSI